MIMDMFRVMKKMQCNLQSICALFFLVAICQVSAQCTSSVQQASGGKVWLQRTSGRLRLGPSSSISLTLCASLSVTVQLWQHEGDHRYRLVWLHEVPAQPTEKLGRKIKIRLSSEITIESSHRVGVAVNQGGPIPVHMETSNAQMVYSEVAADEQRMQEVYIFMDLAYPYAFDIDFCSGAECPQETGLEMSEDTTTEEEKDACILRQSYGYVHLQSNVPIPSGVIRAIRAYFCSSTPVWVQVWEKLTGSDVDHMLLWQKQVTGPAGNQSWQVIPLDPEEYFLMKDTYHLALYSPQPLDKLPIASVFSETSAMIFSEPLTSVKTCWRHSFDPLDFPVRFRIELCRTNDCGEDSSDLNASSPTRELCVTDTAADTSHANITQDNTNDVVDAAATDPKAGALGGACSMLHSDWSILLSTIFCLFTLPNF